jgi:hypothetical protein
MPAEPTPKQMEALCRALESRRGLRQELDVIRDAAEEQPVNEGSDNWMMHEHPIIIEIMRVGVQAVLDAS